MIKHIAGYRFISLAGLEALRQNFLVECARLQLLGTILLAPEGINLMLAGSLEKIDAFKFFLEKDSRFADLFLNETVCKKMPFKKLLIKLKREIISFGIDSISPECEPASKVSPDMFKKYLDEKKEVIILDTRNTYEVAEGTFEGAVHLEIENFRDFPKAILALKENKKKPVIMFCTGGVRCEKAAIYMKQIGFRDVSQLEGGILHYFKKYGTAHYQGDCFVFDERRVLGG